MVTDGSYEMRNGVFPGTYKVAMHYSLPPRMTIDSSVQARLAMMSPRDIGRASVTHHLTLTIATS